MAGSGIRTAYPRSTSRCGFQRQCQPAHDPIGPPWAKTTSGAGAAEEASGGRMSHEPMAVPSAAVAESLSTRPRPATPPSSMPRGSSVGLCFSPVVANLTIRAGAETVERRA